MRVLSRLNGWPMRSPVNASPIPSRASAHDSGVDAVRYSFIVMDLHHLLLAGLPAHSALPHKADIDRRDRDVRFVPGAVITPMPRTVGPPGVRIPFAGKSDRISALNFDTPSRTPWGLVHAAAG